KATGSRRLYRASQTGSGTEPLTSTGRRRISQTAAAAPSSSAPIAAAAGRLGGTLAVELHRVAQAFAERHPGRPPELSVGQPGVHRDPVDVALALGPAERFFVVPGDLAERFEDLVHAHGGPGADVIGATRALLERDDVRGGRVRHVEQVAGLVA